MNDTKFTPGPWFIAGSIPEEGVDCFWIKSQPSPAMRGFTKDIATADGYQSDPERAANAHLIAAAPDMYEALNKIINRLQMDIDDGSRPDEWSMKALVKYAKEAQPKAKGETQ